jgi:tripartite-type tricarboxylate transporter receptor subunit TctC
LNVNSLDQLMALARTQPGKLNWAGVTGALDFIFAGFQAWPMRPVKFILTLGAGSGADIGARLFADRLVQRWDQPVVVENRPGGDGLVAINAFVGAHDDHQLLFSPTSSFTAHPFLHDHAGMPLELRQRIAAVIRAVADDTIKQRLTTTGQLLNVGGPEEFAKSIEAQRAQVAAFAKELGVAEMPQD